MTKEIAVPLDFYRRLQTLATKHQRSVSELLQQAVEIHYGETAVAARMRVIDRLARLEASLGDPSELADEITAESRRIRRRG